MDTPIYSFLTKYRGRKPIRLHMPGHKGIGPLGVEGLDITEVSGADVLYRSGGIIRESERICEALFGSGRTVYSTEGSSLSIRCAVALAVRYAKRIGRTPRILAARNAHRSFTSAVAMCDPLVDWIFPNEGNLLSTDITPGSLSERLSEYDEAPIAVYVTAPDYLGNIPNIKEIAGVCHRYGTLLIVDNAHGAYLRFLPEDIHPITLGADIVCDSAHKTLPVLTGGGYLHISKNATMGIAEEVEDVMAHFASTSPSYLILASLDLANAYIKDGYRERLTECVGTVKRAKEKLSEGGYVLSGVEPMKITLMTKPYGYRGWEILDMLSDGGIEAEFADDDYLTLMISAENTSDEIEAAVKMLLSIPKREPIYEKMPVLPRPERVLSPREAFFAASEVIALSDAEGRILSDLQLSCPPAIPIAICGERIDGAVISAMKYYGTETVKVVLDKYT